MRRNRTGRNDPCPCGSGAKYKKCCLGKTQDLKVKLHPGDPVIAEAPAGTDLMDLANFAEHHGPVLCPDNKGKLGIVFWNGETVASRDVQDGPMVTGQTLIRARELLRSALEDEPLDRADLLMIGSGPFKGGAWRPAVDDDGPVYHFFRADDDMDGKPHWTVRVTNLDPEVMADQLAQAMKDMELAEDMTDLAREDQMNAAAAEATRIVTDDLEGAGYYTPSDSWSDRMTSTVSTITAQFDNAQWKPCEHASPDSPQVLNWIPSRPGGLVCDDCFLPLIPLLRKSNPDRRCDICGSKEPGQAIIPYGNVLIHAGVCNECADYHEAA